MNAAACRNSAMALRRAAPAVLLLASLAGCAPFRPGLPSDPVVREQAAEATQGAGAVIAREARNQIGTPYRYGGNDPRRGFDCSGLVTFVHAQEGISVPRTAAAQYAAARKVDRDDLQAGDLVFFRLVPGSREVSHVGVYTGQGRFVHAPQSGRNVVEASLDEPFFRERFAGSGRFYEAGSGAGARVKSSPK